MTQYVPKEVLDYAPEIPKIDYKEYIPELPEIDLSVTSDVRGLWNKGLVFHRHSMIRPIKVRSQNPD